MTEFVKLQITGTKSQSQEIAPAAMLLQSMLHSELPLGSEG